MKDKSEGSGVSFGIFDKIIERVQNYGKLIIVVGGFFVGAVIFYLNVKSTSDLAVADNVEISQLRIDLIKKIQNVVETVNKKLEEESNAEKQNHIELKKADAKNLEIAIENSKDIQYLKGYLKIK